MKKLVSIKQKIQSNRIVMLFMAISMLMILTGVGFAVIDNHFSFALIGDDTVEVDINKKYLESGAIAKFFGKKLAAVKINGNVNIKKLGKYNVAYTAHLLCFKKELNRTVVVKDLEKPVIELKGEKNIFLGLGEQYNEPGFKATDNLDGDITSKVEINGNVDVNKAGEYKLEYIIKDSSDNKSTVERNIEVVDRNTILRSSLPNFKLDGLFSDVVLKYNPNKEYDYFKDTVFVGDSNVIFLYQNGQYISANQAWGRLNLNIAQINSSEFPTLVDGNNVTLDNALKAHKPKYLIVSVGINSALYMGKEQLINETQKIIDNLKKNYPDTKLIFSAIFPVYTGTLDESLQYNINQYNYYVLELCHKNKINYIDFADQVKDEKGLADHKYFECTSSINCGFHLNAEGKAKYIDYVKHLDFGRN